MTVNRGLWVPIDTGNVGTTDVEARLADVGLFESNDGINPRSGLLHPNGPNVVTGKANMSYDIAGINPLINRVTNEGAYRFAATGVTNVPTGNAPATNSRIDVIWVKQNDQTKAGDTNNLAVAGVTQGAAAPTPVAPAIPTGAMELARATVLSTTTATSTASITQTWRYAALAGVAIPVRNVTERAEISAPRVDQRVRRLDRPGTPVEIWSGTEWRTAPEALGRLAESVQPGSFDGFSAGEFFADSIASVDLKKGRKYRIDYRFNLVAPSGASIAAVFNFKRSLPTDTGFTGTTIESPTIWSPPVANSGGTYNLTTTYTPAADETVRILISSGRIAGTSLYNLSGRTLQITDEGAQF